MADSNRASQPTTVADWLAEGSKTMELFCNGAGCGHRAILDIAGFDPRTIRDQIVRRLRCTACGSRNVSLMQDMGAHYRELEATGWTAGSGR